VRAGFDKAWRDKDYQTIIEVAKKVPETVCRKTRSSSCTTTTPSTGRRKARVP
jgi:hypothetical protein